jgi:hypothetical protein
MRAVALREPPDCCCAVALGARAETVSQSVRVLSVVRGRASLQCGLRRARGVASTRATTCK